MSDKHYDVIIVGAGHNGLVAAAYLARAGKRVLVLERRAILGGTLSSEDFGGFQAQMVQSGALRPGIARQLGLELPAASGNAGFISLLPGGERLILEELKPAAALDSIRQFSPRDAGRWPDFVGFMNHAARFLEKSYATIIPSLPKPPARGALDLAALGLDLKLAGRGDMLSIIRSLAMSAYELVEEYFESESLRAAIASLGVYGVALGPLSAGSAFNLIHNWMNRGGLAQRYLEYGPASIQALADLIKARGGEIRTGAEVSAITVDMYQCTGVKMATGEEIQARAVLSVVDPKRTFLSLVGPANLPPEFVWQVRSIKMRGSAAKVHLGVEALPAGMHAGMTYVIAPSIRYLEQAYDAAKYGQISSRPYMEVTTGPNVISIHFQYAPYFLKGSSWSEQCASLEDLAIATLSSHFPGLDSRIVQSKTLSPHDLEEAYGLTEGDTNHGQLMLDQFFFMRPIPGYAGHKTPVDGLFLGGSGVHAGGGISGASGRNAARVIMRELK